MDQTVEMRLWRLEQIPMDVQTLRFQLLDHEQRLRAMERAPASSPQDSKLSLNKETLKEIAMLLSIGAMIGMMITTRDPSGVIGVAKSVIGATKSGP